MWKYELSKKTHGDQQRSSDRRETDQIAMLMFRNRQVGVKILDLSTSGTRVGLSKEHSEFEFPDSMRIDIPGLFCLPIKKHWQTETELGASFQVDTARRAMFGRQMEAYLRHRRSTPKLRTM